MKDSDKYNAYLLSVLEKFNQIIHRGDKIIKKIPELVKKKQLDRHHMDILYHDLSHDRIPNKRYNLKMSSKLIGVSVEDIINAEILGNIPQPEYRIDTKLKRRSGYNINHINHMRSFFRTNPSIPEDKNPIILGMLNLKGGSQKTTSCHLFSQYLAILGYKVLVVDTDPQASLSFFFGKRSNENVFYEDTIAPFLLEHDQALVDVGFPKNSSKSLDYSIKKTYWNNIDIIPSCLQNLNIDLMLPKLFDYKKESLFNRIMKLRYGLLSIKNKYDFILIDGTPSLNLSTLNVFSACDLVFVPTPASMIDFTSTLQFVDLITETIGAYTKEKSYPNIPDVRFFITNYSKSSYAHFMGDLIQGVFSIEPGDVLINKAYISDEIGKTNNSAYSIYEQNFYESDNRKRLKLTIDKFDLLFKEMYEISWDVCYGNIPKSSYIDNI